MERDIEMEESDEQRGGVRALRALLVKAGYNETVLEGAIVTHRNKGRKAMMRMLQACETARSRQATSENDPSWRRDPATPFETIISRSRHVLETVEQVVKLRI